MRSISGSVSKTWNSINPATLSGAIDVLVVEQEDGSLACSPFHIRFGKFSLLRPSEKKVEFRVNGVRQDFPMKLGEGGEAFFVFETRDRVPEALQTSPPVSPTASPELRPASSGGAAGNREADETERGVETEGEQGSAAGPSSLLEPEPFALEGQQQSQQLLHPIGNGGAGRRLHSRSTSEATHLSHTGVSPPQRPGLADLAVPELQRTATDSALPAAKMAIEAAPHPRPPSPVATRSARSASPPPVSADEAKARAMNLSKKLWTSNISNQVTDAGDLMLDMTGFKSTDGEALHAELIARQLLSEEIDGPYDIGALIGADEKGNVWIYSSEEAKEAASRKASDGILGAYHPAGYASSDAISDPGYHSDDNRSDAGDISSSAASSHTRRDSDSALGMASQPGSPAAQGDPNKNYAKTLRLTSEQLKAMDLQPGANSMAFTVNRATCQATLWRWHHAVPIVISDIDGTITKSDVLGHVLNSLGRDWTHQGVAKLFADIAANGYNFLYLTSRSVGQADITRAYLDGVVQDGYRLPKGPVILSPDRTIAALRREIYLRKPEIFKMACLRDIMALFIGHGGATNTHASAEAGLHAHLPSHSTYGKGKGSSPFYAGFGNRLTDALSYRSVNIPSTRIFTINSNSEVSLDLLSLNTYKTAYGGMREIVDHYFPPVGLLVQGGGEEFTDFNYWRERPLDIEDFTDSEDEEEEEDVRAMRAEDDLEEAKRQRLLTASSLELQRTETNATNTRESLLSEDDAGDDDALGSSVYFSEDAARASLEQSLAVSSVVDDEDGSELADSMLLDDEEEEEEEEDGEADDADEDSDDEEEDDAPLTPDLRGRKTSHGDREATPRRSDDMPGIRQAVGLGLNGDAR